jgi:zinc D-Ala-D-Ala carboxypeptidase
MTSWKRKSEPDPKLHLIRDDQIGNGSALWYGKRPNGTEIENMRLLCENVLQKPVRNYYGMGVKVNSGFRHPLVNAKVGGSTTSDHCKGMAADIEIPSIANADLAQWIVDNCEFRQVILEFYTQIGVPDSGWVHVSYNPADNKKQVLTAYKKDGKTVYEPGLIA